MQGEVVGIGWQPPRPLGVKRWLTAEDLLAMGKAFHGELVEGRLTPMTPAGMKHGIVAQNLAYCLETWRRQARPDLRVVAGEAGYWIRRDPDTVRAPDVALVSAARSEGVTGFLTGAPEHAFEVLSPTDRAADVREKLADYFAAGGISVWVVDCGARTVTVWHAGAQASTFGGDETATDLALAGLGVPLAELFR